MFERCKDNVNCSSSQSEREYQDILLFQNKIRDHFKGKFRSVVCPTLTTYWEKRNFCIIGDCPYRSGRLGRDPLLSDTVKSLYTTFNRPCSWDFLIFYLYLGETFFEI